MSRLAPLALIAAVALGPAVAPARAADGDPLMRALEGELQRSMDGLRLPDAPAPYFLSYGVLDTTQVYAEATLGALVRSGLSRARPLRCELRVGDYALDNSNFTTFGDDPSGLTAASLVLDDDELVIARDLWVVTDEAYKSAVEGLSQKLSARERAATQERPADYAPAEAVVALDWTPPASPDRAALEERARTLSAVLRAVPGIENSRVYLADWSWRRYVVTSEGTRIVEPGRFVVLRVVAEVRAEDDRLVKDTLSWIAPTPGQLPADDELDAELDALAARLAARLEAPVVEDYLGPVVFEGQAAAELYRQLLIPQLMGTPGEEAGDDWGRDDGVVLARVGRRVLPRGFDVVDDPAAELGEAAGAYRFDDEGVPAERVELVEEGVVQTLLMSRTPREDIAASNGHGRGSRSSRLVGMPGVTTVTNRHGRGQARLYRQAFKMARQSGLDHVLVIRTLDDPAMHSGVPVRRIHFGDDGGPSLTEPLIVVRRHPDGREEPVRNARFLLADHRVLRDIVATTTLHTEHHYLAPAVLHGGTAWVGGPTSGVPVTLRVPDAVLISELELGPQPPEQRPPPLTDSPLSATAR